MQTIRFKADVTQTSAQMSVEQFEHMLPAMEADVDEAFLALEAYTNASLGLGEVVAALESIDGFGEGQRKLIETAADNALRPVGVRFADIAPSLESNGEGIGKRFIEAIKRIWRAIKDTAKRVWKFIRQSFSKIYVNHRMVLSQINNARVTLNGRRSALAESATLEMSGLEILIKTNGKTAEPAPNVKALETHLRNFGNVRQALIERYAVKLSAVINDAFKKNAGTVHWLDPQQLVEIRAVSNRAFSQFDHASISRIFPGYLIVNETTTKVPLSGGLELQIRGKPLPSHPEADDFSEAVRSLSVDIGRTEVPNAGPWKMQAMTHSEISQMLDLAETMIKDIMTGRMDERSKKIEAKIEGFQRYIDECVAAVSKAVVGEEHADTLRLAQRVLNEQAAMTTAFTGWGGPVFMKMETASLRIASALTTLCGHHIQNLK